MPRARASARGVPARACDVEFGDEDFDRGPTVTFWGFVGTSLLLGIVAGAFRWSWV
jgi:hypothetical protein